MMDWIDDDENNRSCQVSKNGGWHPAAPGNNNIYIVSTWLSELNVYGSGSKVQETLKLLLADHQEVQPDALLRQVFSLSCHIVGVMYLNFLGLYAAVETNMFLRRSRSKSTWYLKWKSGFRIVFFKTLCFSKDCMICFFPCQTFVSSLHGFRSWFVSWVWWTNVTWSELRTRSCIRRHCHQTFVERPSAKFHCFGKPCWQNRWILNAASSSDSDVSSLSEQTKMTMNHLNIRLLIIHHICWPCLFRPWSCFIIYTFTD